MYKQYESCTANFVFLIHLPPPCLSSPSTSIHHSEHHTLLPAVPLTHLLRNCPLKVDLIMFDTCHSVVSHPLSSSFPHPLSSLTLPSVSLPPCSLPSCSERQWHITVTLCFDESTHSEEHTLHFLWCHTHTNITCHFFFPLSSSILSLLLFFPQTC